MYFFLCLDFEFTFMTFFLSIICLVFSIATNIGRTDPMNLCLMIYFVVLFFLNKYFFFDVKIKMKHYLRMFFFSIFIDLLWTFLLYDGYASDRTDYDFVTQNLQIFSYIMTCMLTSVKIPMAIFLAIDVSNNSI